MDNNVSQGSYLLQDVLLPHELLSLSVGFVDHDLQDVLSVVGDVHHKEHQVFQELGHGSGWTSAFTLVFQTYSFPSSYHTSL